MTKKIYLKIKIDKKTHKEFKKISKNANSNMTTITNKLIAEYIRRMKH